MPKALYLSPIIPSFDVDQSLAFFTDLLGFTVTFQGGGYGICEKDGLSIHFKPAVPDIGEVEVYLEVDDVDALWAGMKDKIGDLRHKAPFDQPYKMREAHIDVPATRCLLYLGQCI